VRLHLFLEALDLRRPESLVLGSVVNILIINDTAHVNGGAAKLAISEAIGLADRGHSIFFLAAVKPIAPELSSHPNIKVCCTDQFDLLADPNRLRAFLQGWWNRKALRAAQDLVKPLHADDTLVHLHIWSRALSSSVARAVLDAGLPVVCTLHDFLLACPTGTFFLHREEKICELTPMSAACIGTNCDTRNYSQKLWRVGRQMVQQHFGHIPSHLTDYIVHSKLAYDVMRPYLPVDATVHAVNGYIEATKTEPASPGQNTEFVYLGRLVREKGVTMLARCAAAEGIPLTFIGSGPLEGEVRQAYPKAAITGWVDRAGSVSYVRSARALVFPSLWYETLGLVVLEAAAHGIPCIVPDTSAAREMIEDGVTGLLFQGGNESDLRATMRRLQDSQVASGLGRAAYDRFWASDFASLDAHIASLEGIYRKMLQRVPQDAAPNLCMQKGVA
jgi:glycosyltransferase involved in cell wall biosynthesis